MTDDLENALSRLGQTEAGGMLDGLEARVWEHVAARQRAPSTSALWGWRSAAFVTLLAIGVIAGGAGMRSPRPELALFSSHVALAPSTLLGAGQ